MKDEVIKKYRDRITREDDLLISRTTIFLVTNGLLLTAVSVANYPIIGILISILGLILTFFWFMCSWQNWKVIRNLTIKHLKENKKDRIEKIVQNSLFSHGWKRPTDLIAKPIPISFLVIWIAILSFFIIKLL